MALKRRITSDVSTTPESNKRVTRSSTKQGLSTIPDSAAADSQPQRNKPKSKNNSERRYVKGGDKEEEEDKDSASTLSIHSDLTKTPVQCHIYRAPTQHKPTSASTLIFTFLYRLRIGSPGPRVPRVRESRRAREGVSCVSCTPSQPANG
jgi:hypothetical protein